MKALDKEGTPVESRIRIDRGGDFTTHTISSSDAHQRILLQCTVPSDSRTTVIDGSAKGFGAQLSLGAFAGTGIVSDTLVINGGDARGVQLSASGTAVVRASNIFNNAAGLFIDPLLGDYCLAPGSSAIDAGDNAPPGVLGPLDLDGGARVVGPAVDIGAYEWNDFLFGDRFENRSVPRVTVP